MFYTDKDKICGVDVDTLIAFMTPGQLLYKPETEAIKPNLRLITSIFQRHRIKILCFNDKHYGDEEHKFQESELTINGGPFGLHAENGTKGAEKIPETLLSHDIMFVPNGSSNCLNYEYTKNALFQAMQIMIEKQSYDVFYSKTNPGGNINIDKVLEILGLEHFFVYGVYTDYCIKTAVLGLLARKKSVWVIEDAIVPYNVNPNDGESALDEMAKLGAGFTNTVESVDLLGYNLKSE